MTQATGVRRVAVALVLSLAAAVPGGAETVRASDPDGVVAALRDAGFAAELRRTRAGDPLIRAATPGELPFQMRFYGCLGGRDCTSLQLVAGFAARGVSAETVNGWNAALRYGRVHVTGGGQPVLAMDVAPEPGGLTPAQFAARLATWDALVEGVLARLDGL